MSEKIQGVPRMLICDMGVGEEGEVFTLPHRFLTESSHSCGFRRNAICHSGDNQFWRNLAIPELRLECSLEWSRTESVGMQYLLLLLPFLFYVFPN